MPCYPKNFEMPQQIATNILGQEGTSLFFMSPERKTGALSISTKILIQHFLGSPNTDNFFSA